jgi:hypothetical protein
MLLSMRVRTGHETEGEGGGPAGGWDPSGPSPVIPRRSRDPRQRNPAEAEQAGRPHVCELFLGEVGKAAALRVLREGYEGNGMEITNRLVALVFSCRAHPLDPITSWTSGVPHCWDGRP